MKIIIKETILFTLLTLSITSCNQQHKKNTSAILTSGISLLSNPSRAASCVYLTVDEKSNPIVSWMEEDSSGRKLFQFARWDTSKNGFKCPIEIPIAGNNVALHEEGMPKIAVRENGSIVAIYEVSIPQEGQKWGVGDILYTQSDDQGRTWSAPKSVSTQKRYNSSLSFSGITRLSDGQIAVAWLDGNLIGSDQPGRPVMFARTYAGKGFSEPLLIDSLACECCRISLAAGPSGQIIIAYRDLLPGNTRDISLSISSIGGASFAASPDLSGDNWQIDGCPHAGPRLSVSNGKIFTTWYTGGSSPGIYYASTDMQGKLLEKQKANPDARFADITVTGDKFAIIASNENYPDGDSIYSRIVLTSIKKNGLFRKQITSPEKHGTFPMIQMLNPQNLLIAWRDGNKIYYTIQKTTSITHRVDTQKFSQPLLHEISDLPKEMHHG